MPYCLETLKRDYQEYLKANKINKSQVKLRKLLQKHKIDSVPLQIRHSRTLGGSFHCVTTDIWREN